MDNAIKLWNFRKNYYYYKYCINSKVWILSFIPFLVRIFYGDFIYKVRKIKDKPYFLHVFTKLLIFYQEKFWQRYFETQCVLRVLPLHDQSMRILFDCTAVKGARALYMVSFKALLKQVNIWICLFCLSSWQYFTKVLNTSSETRNHVYFYLGQLKYFHVFYVFSKYLPTYIFFLPHLINVRNTLSIF